MKYPKEAPLFRLKNTSNEHWIAGDIVELMEVEPMGIGPNGPPLDYRVMHYCSEYSHEGYMWSLDNLEPITPAARDMLAIARGAR